MNGVLSCPRCGATLAIVGRTVHSKSMGPEAFMALPFSESSSARWVCDDHGDVGRVVVAVVDDEVRFVPVD